MKKAYTHTSRLPQHVIRRASEQAVQPTSKLDRRLVYRVTSLFFVARHINLVQQIGQRINLLWIDVLERCSESRLLHALELLQLLNDIHNGIIRHSVWWWYYTFVFLQNASLFVCQLEHKRALQPSRYRNIYRWQALLSPAY